MRVIINAPARADNPNCIAAEPVFADSPNIAAGCRINGRVARRKNILPLMQPVIAARRTE